MTAQEQGLRELVTIARAIVPPTLEFVVLIYKPTGELCMTSVMYPHPTMTPTQQYERAKVAAQAFLTDKPHPSFNSEKN
jgi:hypothetical protein